MRDEQRVDPRSPAARAPAPGRDARDARSASIATRQAASSGGDGAQGETVGVDAEPGDRAGRDAGDRPTCAGTPRGRPGSRCAPRSAGHVSMRAGVAQGVRVVRERGRVQHHGGALVLRLVQPADQLGLVVGLAHVAVEPERLAPSRTQSAARSSNVVLP